MGVYCDIGVNAPPTGAFGPGSVVSGAVQYAIEDNTPVDQIIITLNGTETLSIRKSDSKPQDSRHYHGNEIIVNFAAVVKHNQTTGGQLNRAEFSFVLPNNAPSSMKFTGRHGSYSGTCNIIYNIQAVFTVSGRLSFNKKFEKEIRVVSSAITPKLPTNPMTRGETKKLFQPFRRGKSIVSIKATIQNSVILPGGRVEIAYEIQNNTNLTIRAIEAKLMEAYNFYAYGIHIVEMAQDVPSMFFKRGALESGETFSTTTTVVLPQYVHNIDNAKLVKRSYFFLITAELPTPHFDAKLLIPIQVGHPYNMVYESHPTEVPGTSYHHQDPPPSYWQSTKDMEKSS
ncbi:uncharacterized protein LOC114356977 [Ostrinia furnacalis]|uniref:uncharacterized protein LOC114356977 n=1 Tax=Ostrinia furnacalis TaxID=93504 RepID=UPI00103A0068|nr:uncharacterized protein LOC114356977 [Ostrinia furnacalis]